MSYLEKKQVKQVFEIFFNSFRNELSALELDFINVVDFESPTGSKSVRSELASKGGDIKINVSFHLKNQSINSTIESKARKDSFFVEEYLDFQKNVDQRKKLNRERGEAGEQFLKRYLHELLLLLQTVLKKTVKGEDWVKVPLPDDVIEKYR